MKKLLLLSAAAIAIAGPAHAGPVAAVVGWVGSTLAAGGVAAAALRIGIGLGLNLLATALSPAIGGTPKVSVKFDVEFGDESPLSFIAGLYGMNFQPEKSPWNMPELGWRYGYPFALLLMAAIVVAMLWYFARRGWLSSSEPTEKP